MKKLYQKARNLKFALPLIVGLSPLVAKAEEPKGYAEIAGEIAQFTGNNYLTEIYGNLFGGSVGGGFRLWKSPLFLGGKLSFLVGSGDSEEERSFASKRSETQELTIVGLEPYLELSGKNIFARLGYGNYSISDKLKEQQSSLFRERYSEDTYKDNVSGVFYGAGAKLPLTTVNSDIDGSLMIELNSRNASPIKTLSVRIGADFNF